MGKVRQDLVPLNYQKLIWVRECSDDLLLQVRADKILQSYSDPILMRRGTEVKESDVLELIVYAYQEVSVDRVTLLDEFKSLGKNFDYSRFNLRYQADLLRKQNVWSLAELAQKFMEFQA